MTNFQTVKKSIERMNELEKWESSGVFKAISKKEASRLTKELNRLQKLLGGIREMKVLPDVVFVIDPVDTAGAVRESRVLGIPVVAVCDTNSDPDLIDVPVPGNDDAARSIKLFCTAIADAVLEGRAENEAAKQPAEAAVTEGETEKAPANPAMAKAFESIMLESEKAEQEAEAQKAEEVKAEPVQEEVKAEEKPQAQEEVKEEAPAEETAEKPAEEAAEKPAKKTAAKKTTAKKPAAKKTAAAKKTTAKKAVKADKSEEAAEEAK